MEAPLRIRCDQFTTRGDHTHTGQTLLTLVLITVGILVVVHLADQVGAIEQRVGNDTHRRARLIGQRFARRIAEPCHHLIDVLAFSYTRANHQQHLQGAHFVRCKYDRRERQHAVIGDRFQRLSDTVSNGNLRRALHVLEARRNDIHQRDIADAAATRVARRNRVGHQLATGDVDLARHLAQVDHREATTRIERYVVVHHVLRTRA